MDLKEQTNQAVELEQRNFVEDFLSDMNSEQMVYLSKRFDMVQKAELRRNASQALKEARASLEALTRQPSTSQQVPAPHPTQRSGGSDPTVMGAASDPGGTNASHDTAREILDKDAFEEDWANFQELPQQEREKLEREWQEEQQRADLRV